MREVPTGLQGSNEVKHNLKLGLKTLTFSDELMNLVPTEVCSFCLSHGGVSPVKMSQLVSTFLTQNAEFHSCDVDDDGDCGGGGWEKCLQGRDMTVP